MRDCIEFGELCELLKSGKKTWEQLARQHPNIRATLNRVDRKPLNLHIVIAESWQTLNDAVKELGARIVRRGDALTVVGDYSPALRAAGVAAYWWGMAVGTLSRGKSNNSNGRASAFNRLAQAEGRLREKMESRRKGQAGRGAGAIKPEEIVALVDAKRLELQERKGHRKVTLKEVFEAIKCDSHGQYSAWESIGNLYSRQKRLVNKKL